MIDFSRTFCDLHPNELITNFCCKDQCNVGLCATCICNHTETHIQKKTAPEYENIRATYSRMQENIRSRIANFEQQKVRIHNVIEVIHTKRKQITEIISQARSETLDFVNKFYEAKQKQLIRKVQADEKKMGLHNENRMESLLNVISRDINSLFASAQDLNSQAFLESFHRIRTQTLVNSAKTYREVEDQVRKNQCYETNVTVNVAFVNQIKSALEKSITLYFGEKRREKVPEYKENKNSRIVTGSLELSSTVSQQFLSQQSEKDIPEFQRSELPQRFQSQRYQPQRYEPQRFQSQRFQAKRFQPQRPQSMTKMSVPAFQQRYVNNSTEIASPKFYPQAQHRPNPSFIQALVQPTDSPLIRNNSIQILQANPNHQNFSRIDYRGNSAQKNLKENLHRSVIMNHPPFIQNNSYSQPINDLTKKSRRSGLTILKSNDQTKA